MNCTQFQLLVEYAKEQGSAHSDKLYVTYTKLANTIIGGKRDDMTASELNTLTLVESIIKQNIEIDMSMGMYYKDIAVWGNYIFDSMTGWKISFHLFYLGLDFWISKCYTYYS